MSQVLYCDCVVVVGSISAQMKSVAYQLLVHTISIYFLYCFQ